ncbi:ribonuclease R [bacterium]|nr:ribonuclease R [bacterium]
MHAEQQTHRSTLCDGTTEGQQTAFMGRRDKKTAKRRHTRPSRKKRSVDTSQPRPRAQAIAYDKAETAVLETLQERPGSAMRVKEVVDSVDSAAGDERTLRKAVDSLLRKGALDRVKGKKVRLSHDNPLPVRGTFSMSNRGAGFIRPEGGGEDLFVAPRDVYGARPGDRVEAVVIEGAYGSRDLERARVVRVLERENAPVVGRFIQHPGRGGVVIPDNPKLPGPVQVPEAERNSARDEDRVQVEIDHYGRYGKGIRGRVQQVFGRADDPRARFKALIVEYKFRENFAGDALDEAEQASGELPDGELRKRWDLRDDLIVTIDPASAKDFDDAISLGRLKGGDYELGVHIADVSWYVRRGGALDREARQRGTSVYTAHGTLPMLPERLSSDLCSLREGEDKRAFSVFMTLSPSGEVKGWKLGRSVIRSKKRFTYEEAQHRIEDARHKWGEDLPKWRRNSMNVFLVHLDRLTKNMRALRFQKGGIDLEVPEYEVEIDENDEAVGIHEREVMESNHLVEECMLAANRSVTEYARRARGSGVKAFVFRVHDRPDPERLQELEAFAQAMELPWPFGKDLEHIDAKQINEWLHSLEGHPLADITRIHTLRSMAKAAYDVENIGHYGLGFNNYTHFTSPIRRYPDLMVHRILLAHLEHRETHSSDTTKELQRSCQLSSERERAAQEMERASLKARQAEYFSRHIGDVFDGMVTGVIPKGVFVEIKDTGAQGLIEEGDMGAVFFNRKVNGFVSIDGDEIFRPGKRLRVRVIRADMHTGHLDLAPV